MSVLALDSLSRPDEVRRLAAELAWSADKAQKAVEMVGTAAGTLDGSLSTRVFTNLFTRVAQVAPELDLACPSMPLLGTLPSGRINALAIAVPASAEYILAFDSGLWIFADAIADCVASAFAEDGSNTVSLLPHPLESEANRASLATASRVVARYLFTGNPFFTDYPIPARSPHRALKQAVRDAFLLFIVGHEFAHVALGHLENAVNHFYSLADRVSCTTRTPDSHARELDADRAGTLLMMTASLQPDGYPFWFTGPLAGFFLRAAGFLYHYFEALGGPALADQSHPPAEERRRVAHETARGALPENMVSSYEYWASVLDELGAHLEDATDALIEPLVRDGWSLAEVWKQTRIG